MTKRPTKAKTSEARLPRKTEGTSSPTELPESELREKIEREIGPVVGAAQRGQIVERVFSLMRAELFRGPLPHPRHLAEYEKIQPGLADRIVTMAEQARQRADDRLDQAVKQEYEDRRLGMYLGFAALIVLLVCGTLVSIFSSPVLGGSILGAAVLGTVIGTFVHGRRRNGSAKHP